MECGTHIIMLGLGTLRIIPGIIPGHSGITGNNLADENARKLAHSIASGISGYKSNR